MSSDEQTAPDAYAEHPEESVFPGAGERVDADDRQRALDAAPRGNATVGDTVDTDGVDSSAHESGAGSEEVAEQVDRADSDQPKKSVSPSSSRSTSASSL